MHEVLLATASHGMAIRFGEEDVRVPWVAPRPAFAGLNWTKAATQKSSVASKSVDPALEKKLTLLTVCENGYGKRTELWPNTATSRAAARASSRSKRPITTGPSSASVWCEDKDDVMIMTEKGISIRMNCKAVSVISRNTQGVRLVRLEEGDKVAAVASVVAEERKHKTELAA